MNRQKVLLILCVLTALAASMTLTRCGSGVGSDGTTASLNSVKF